MKKTAKSIIALVGVLALMGGGVGYLLYTKPEEDDPVVAQMPGSEKTEVIIVKDKNITGPDPETGIMDTGVIKTVDVTNEHGELHVIQLTGKTDDSAATYTLKGYEDVLLNTSVVGTLANNANGLTCTDLIEENCEDISKFGLDKPEITVDITYESGSRTKLLIGDESPTGTDTYVMVDGEKTIYTVRDSALLNYHNKLEEFMEKTVLEAPPDDAYPEIKKVTIEREDIDYDIVLELVEKDKDAKYTGGTSASHMMTSPVEAYLAVERSADVTNGMFGLSAADIYSVHCKEQDIKEAGLDEPFCTTTMECSDGKKYVLLLSEPFDDSKNGKCCYAMLEGGNTIFVVKTEKAQWVTVLPVDIASKIFIAGYVWNISELTATAGSTVEKFVIKRTDPEVELDSYKSSDFTVTRNGQSFDSERYRLFYSFLISASAEDFAFEEEYPSDEPMAAIEYTDSYTGKTTKIEFFDYSNLTSLIAVDGKSKFVVAKSYVNTLIDNIKRIPTDEDFVTTWK